MIAVAEGVPGDGAQPSSLGEVACLTYHAVLPHESEYLYNVSVSQFSEHLAAFCNPKVRLPIGARLPSISFDDGHISAFEYAFPLLEAAGIKATFFVLPGKIGRSPDSLSWQQVKLMLSAGHRIESHGWSHGMLTQYSASDLEREIVSSKLELEDRLGQPVTSLSAPGGRWNERVVEECARAGYKTLFHSNPWAAVRRMDGVVVRGRLMVTRKTGEIELFGFTNASALTRMVHSTSYAIKLGVRGVLGEQLYHSLWCKLANFRPADGMEVKTNGSVHAE